MIPKILIVDDEAYIRTLLKRNLLDLEDDYDLEILLAENGKQALDMIKEEKPALVFLDVMMPQMNGFDVCSTVKHELKMSDVTIVMLTAKGQTVDKERGLEAGADYYVTKPFDPDELLEMTIDILGLEEQ